MYLSTTFRIYPTKIQESILHDLICNFDVEVNKVIQTFVENKEVVHVRFKEIANSIPWDSKIEVIKIAKVEFVKAMEYDNAKRRYKYNFCKWTNHNFQFFNNQKLLIQTFEKEVMIIDVFCNEFIKNIISNNSLTSLKIFKRGNKWIGSFTYDYISKTNTNENVMGIDLGIKVPAVAATNTGKIRFFGNGRKKRFIHTKQKKHYYLSTLPSNQQIKYGKKRWSNKLKDIDHKISREIIEFAKLEKIKVIKLENLEKLQKRNSNIQSVNVWSYHRLLTYIIYKAEKEGMQVYLVDPKNTSKKCPNCCKINSLIGRRYLCKCGYTNHRDIVGAINILNTKL